MDFYAAEGIRIVPDQVRRKAGLFRVERDKVESCIRQLDAYIMQLNDEWDGMSSDAFCDRYRELRPALVESQNLIHLIAAELDSAADRFERHDAEMASRLAL